jgi:hypothetical protein
MTEILNFDDLAPVEVEVKVKGKKYILREATGHAAAQYRNAALKAAKMVDGKVVGMDGLADAEPLLVSLCLYELEDLGNGKPPRERPVPVQVVRGWPARLVTALFTKVRDISDLGEGETAEVLERRIQADQAKLQQLRAQQATNGDDANPDDGTTEAGAKNAPAATPAGSA